MPTRPPLTVAEATEALAVSDKTIRRMLKEGILKEQGRDAGKRILISPQSIEAAASQLGRKHPMWPEEPMPSPIVQPNELQQLANMFLDTIRDKDQRIERLVQENADLRADQKIQRLLTDTQEEKVQQLQRELEEARETIVHLQAAPMSKPAETTAQVSRQQEQRTVMGRIRRLLSRV